MAKVKDEIIRARRDVRDESKTQYDDGAMLDYYNRAIPALAGYLGSIKSDWVLSSATKVLAAGENSFSLPTDFNSPRLVEIAKSGLDQKKPDLILKWQQETAVGTPNYFAIHKLNMIFERAVGAETSVYLQYNDKPATMTENMDMPYNDEFNDVIRGAVAMIAKIRNAKGVVGDMALHEFFRSAALSKTFRRVATKKRNLGY